MPAITYTLDECEIASGELVFGKAEISYDYDGDWWLSDLTVETVLRDNDEIQTPDHSRGSPLWNAVKAALEAEAAHVTEEIVDQDAVFGSAAYGRSDFDEHALGAWNTL